MKNSISSYLLYVPSSGELIPLLQQNKFKLDGDKFRPSICDYNVEIVHNGEEWIIHYQSQKTVIRIPIDIHKEVTIKNCKLEILQVYLKTLFVV